MSNVYLVLVSISLSTQGQLSKHKDSMCPLTHVLACHPHGELLVYIMFWILALTWKRVVSVGRIIIFISLQLQKHKGVADPLEVVAAEISDEAILLCLDEFMVCHEFMVLSFKQSAA